MNSKIGLFFGSFNPIHIGHTAIANYILEYSDLSEIWFIVTPQNPFKKDENLINEHFRLEMTKISIADDPRFKASDIEFNLPKPSFTINTLQELNRLYPSNIFVLLMGSDNIINLNKWKDADKIIGNYEIIVYPRQGYPISATDLPPNTKIIDAPIMEISSTMIRNSLKAGKKLSYFLLSDVYKYVKMNDLYERCKVNGAR